MRPKHVVVLAYEDCLGAELFGFADLLLMANRVAAIRRAATSDLFQVTIIGAGRERVRLAGGTRIEAAKSPRDIDLLVVPGFDFNHYAELDAHLLRHREEVALIRRMSARGIHIASICVGAFLLGEAGLLHGRKVTTAWSFVAELERRYPTARVRKGAVILADRTITTTGAFSASADLALHTIRQFAGARIAGWTGKLTLLNQRRESQLPYVDPALIRAGGGSFSEPVKRWLARQAGQRYNLRELAKAFRVSTRTMLRRFKAETGTSPLAFIHEARVRNARVLLESTDLPLVDIAARVGYTDLASFRRVFTRATNLTPGAYRRQFSGR